MNTLIIFCKTEWRKICVLTAVTVLLQIFSNYVIASWAGHNAGGLDSVIAIQSPIDQFIPWFTPMIIVQFIEDASWFIILPLTAWLVGGSKSVFKYFSVSLMIYIFGTIFFLLIPSGYPSYEFLDGTIQNFPANQFMGYQVASLVSDPINVFGVIPSYPNVWACLILITAISAFAKNKFKLALLFLILGIVSTMTTLLLHQCGVAQVSITFGIVAIFYLLNQRFKIDELMFKA